MKVLIVDDDPSILESLASLLMSMQDIEPIPVSSSSLALKMIEHGDIYVVISDFKMPGMDGIELITKIRIFNPLVDCIIMTADQSKETIIKALKAGAHDFLHKPFQMREIMETINESVKRVASFQTLEEMKNRYLSLALSVCQTDKEAADRLGINHRTISRSKKHEK